MSLLLVAAGVAHLPVTPEHLREAPYVGVSFAVFAAVAMALGAYLWRRPSRRAVAVSCALCGAAVLTYVATRMIAFPQIGDDVGNWLEPWGVVSVTLEVLAVAAIAVSRRAAAVVSPRELAVPAAARAVRQHAAA